MDKVKQYFIQHYVLTCFAGGAALGIICFCIIYGLCPLDFSNEAYIINEGTDLPGFQIVWDAYRYAGWKDGIGKFDTLTYPNTTSYVVADQVSLLGLILKIVSPILPQTFQYVGIWGIMCFFFQGGFAAVIIRKFSNNNILSIVFSLPFILATPVLTKLFYHHAQAGQWVLLMTFAIWLYNVEKDHFKVREYIIWSLVGLVTVGTNLYFIPMVGMIFIGYSINCILINKKNFLPSVISLVVYLGTIVVYIGIMGGFDSNFSMDNTFYTEYIDRLQRCGANLNTFFNSSGIAYFGRALNVAKDGQGEGHAYLGAGMIIALAVAISYKIVEIIDYIKGRNTNQDLLTDNSLEKCECDVSETKENNRYVEISLGIVFILSVVVGIGPTLSIGAKILCTIPYPDFILKIWCNFRSTGRMIWPAYYIIYIYIFMVLFKNLNLRFRLNKYFKIVLLGICCIVQIIDLHPYLKGKHNYFSHYQELETTIHDEAWKVLGENYKHMVVLPNSLVNRSDERNCLAKVAIDYNLTLNDYYLARQDLADQTPEYQKKFEQNEFDEETFYVIPYSMLNDFLQYNLHFYKLDDYIVCTKEDISSLIDKREINKEYFTTAVNGEFMYQGKDFSAIFDPKYYYYSYPDLWGYEEDAIEKIFQHFVEVGIYEGRKGNLSFSPKRYKEKNGDLSEAFGENWVEYYLHYLSNGIAENRQIN